MPDEKNSNGKNGKTVGIVDRIKEDLNSLKTDFPAKAKEQIEGLKNPTKTQLYTASSGTSTTTRRAIAPSAYSPTSFCICIPPRLIAMPCVTATPGEWAASLSICFWCSPSPACC